MKLRYQIIIGVLIVSGIGATINGDMDYYQLLVTLMVIAIVLHIGRKRLQKGEQA